MQERPRSTTRGVTVLPHRPCAETAASSPGHAAGGAPPNRMALATSAALDARHATVRRVLEALSLDALVVTAPANIRYLTNHVGTAGIARGDRRRDAPAGRLPVPGSRPPAAADSPAACPSLQDVGRCRQLRRGAPRLPRSRSASARPGFEAAHLTVARHDWLVRTAERAGLAASRSGRPSGSSSSARMVKDDGESGGAARGGAAAARRWPRRPSRGRGRASANGPSPARIEAAMREAGLRASGVRHDRRVRAECGPAALSRRRSTARSQATWWCWTLAASWTDTAAT